MLGLAPGPGLARALWAPFNPYLVSRLECCWLAAATGTSLVMGKERKVNIRADWNIAVCEFTFLGAVARDRAYLCGQGQMSMFSRA